MERGLGGWIALGAHIAARDGVDLAVEQAPFLQRDDVDLVEGTKALLGERRGRAQLAGAERRERPAGFLDVALHMREPFPQRQRLAEAHPPRRVSPRGPDPAPTLAHP